MYNFTLQIISVVSLGIVLFLIARALPRVREERSENSAKPAREHILTRIFGRRVSIEKLDLAVNTVIEKALRKLRVMLMKIDNKIHRHIGQIRKDVTAKKENGTLPTVGAATSSDNISQENITVAVSSSPEAESPILDSEVKERNNNDTAQ